jgi:purine-binding chemotaxis protein CheW
MNAESKRSTPIDWNEVRRRVGIAQEKIDKGWQLSPEEKKQILKARAISLARETKTDAIQESAEMIEFRLSDEKYAIESRFVREVYPLKELTPLPCTPAFVLGIINLRGQIISVIDIKKFFELPEQGLSDLNRAIIVQNGQMEFGILADAIQGVRILPLEEIQPPPSTLTGIRASYLKGITKEGLVVLDIQRMLADPKMIVDEKVEM